MGKRNKSRREFLGDAGKALAGAGLANGPFLSLLDIIAEGAIRKAFAEAAGTNPRKWIDLKFDGSAPHWVYDLFLKATTGDQTNFMQGGNKQLATRYTETAGVYTGTQYAVTGLIRGIRAPYIWSLRVPTASGGTRPMADLLANLLHVRGINAGNAGHGGAQTLHFAPLGAIRTLPSLSADGSSAPVAAVNIASGYYAFRSAAGKSHVNLGGANLIASLLAPFRPSTAITNVTSKEAMVQAYVDASRAALTNSSLARHPDALIAKEAVEGARALMTRSFGDIPTVWAELRDKYKGIIDRALHGTYAGINDKPIGISTARNGEYRYFQAAGVDQIVQGDVRAIIQPETNIDSMANAFALIEFVMLQGLSDSVTARIGGLMSMKNGTTPFNQNVDEHFMGCMPSLLINSLWGISHAACMLELIDKLKAASMFSETVINSSAEFNRSPRVTGIGADHGYQGASVCVYSGIINGPMILGNLAQDATPPTYKGTWGAGAPQEELSNTQIDRGNMGATFAALLRTPSPVTARTSLLNVSGATVTSLIAPGKVIV